MLHVWIVRLDWVVFVFDRSRDGKETKQATKGTCTVPGCVCIGGLLLVRVVCGIRVLSSRLNGNRTSHECRITVIFVQIRTRTKVSKLILWVLL